MKLIKKIAAIMFAFMMVFTLSTNVKAEEGTGKIILDDIVEGQVYKVYQLFTLESYKSDIDESGIDKGPYSYKIDHNSKWWDYFTNNHGRFYVDTEWIDDNYSYIDIKESAKTPEKMREFATNALVYAQDNRETIKPIRTSEKVTQGSTQITFDKLPLGYYLIESSTGKLCNLTTTNPTATIKEKNEVPTVQKHIDTDKTENYVNIGDSVNFTTTINLKEGSKNCVLYDEMSEGFKLNDIATIPLKPTFNKQVKVSTVSDELAEDEYDYEKISDRSFKITFKNKFLNKINTEEYIFVQYTATLTGNANITYASNKKPNTNKTWLTYGDENVSSDIKITNTYTFGIPVFKYTGADKPLKDASFKLYKDDKVIDLIKVADVDGVPTYRKFISGDNDRDKIDVINTNENGKFNITGCNLGTYYLEETKAPEGYNKLKDKIEVTITKDGVDNDTFVKLLQGGDEETTQIKVLNKSGTLLPSTGGMGTTLIYLIGGALVLGSGFVLANKKRAKAK